MADAPWDRKLKTFLKKTGEDFKRFGMEVKDEAGKLMEDVKDPEKQQKLREGLKDFGALARKTAEEVAAFAETGVKKAEGAISKVLVAPAPPDAASPPDPTATPVDASPHGDFEPAPPAATPPSPPPHHTAGPETPKARVKKTIGRK
jgi:hypothetical protein